MSAIASPAEEEQRLGLLRREPLLVLRERRACQQDRRPDGRILGHDHQTRASAGVTSITARLAELTFSSAHQRDHAGRRRRG